MDASTIGMGLVCAIVYGVDLGSLFRRFSKDSESAPIVRRLTGKDITAIYRR